MAYDAFLGGTSSLTNPPEKAFAITPNDDADLETVTRAVYVGSGGNIIAILKHDDNPVTFVNLPTGALLPVRIKRVLIGTTATSLVGLY